jgi:Na+/melibiose symporter-like transporter
MATPTGGAGNVEANGEPTHEHATTPEDILIEGQPELAASPLSKKQKWMFASAFMGMWGPLTMFASHRTTLFVIYYQADVASLSVIGIVMGLVDMFNGPIYGRYSDMGLMNKLRCFPLKSWGRRAPNIVVGFPMLTLGATLMWLSPSRNRQVLSIWYTLCYFLTVNGATISIQAYMSSFQELFATGSERALATVRQAPFLVLTYMIAGALPVLIAFTTSPDPEGECCLTERFDCLYAPPCACFAHPEYNLTAFHAFADMATSPWELFSDMYTDLCALNASSIYEGAEGLYTFGSYSAQPPPWHHIYNIETARDERDLQCAFREYRELEPGKEVKLSAGVPRLRFGAVALLTFLMGIMGICAIRPARATKYVVQNGGAVTGDESADEGVKAADAGERKVSNSMSLLASLRATFSQRPFQVYAGSMFLGSVWTNFLLSNVGIYLVYITRIEPGEFGALYICLVVVNLVCRIGSLPFFAKLLLSRAHLHPAHLCAVLRFIEACLMPLVFVLLSTRGVNYMAVCSIAGGLIGILQSPHDMMHQMLIGWAIDEDASKRNGEPRGAMFHACNGMTQHISQIVLAGILGLWSFAGFEPTVCPSQQPETAYTAIFYSFIIGMPACSLLASLVLLAYPIRGERLKRLKAYKLQEVASLEARLANEMPSIASGVATESTLSEQTEAMRNETTSGAPRSDGQKYTAIPSPTEPSAVGEASIEVELAATNTVVRATGAPAVASRPRHRRTLSGPGSWSHSLDQLPSLAPPEGAAPPVLRKSASVGLPPPDPEAAARARAPARAKGAGHKRSRSAGSGNDWLISREVFAATLAMGSSGIGMGDNGMNHSRSSADVHDAIKILQSLTPAPLASSSSSSSSMPRLRGSWLGARSGRDTPASRSQSPSMRGSRSQSPTTTSRVSSPARDREEAV